MPSESVIVVLSPLVLLADFIKAPLRGALLSASTTMPERVEEKFWPEKEEEINNSIVD